MKNYFFAFVFVFALKYMPYSEANHKTKVRMFFIKPVDSTRNHLNLKATKNPVTTCVLHKRLIQIS